MYGNAGAIDGDGEAFGRGADVVEFAIKGECEGVAVDRSREKGSGLWCFGGIGDANFLLIEEIVALRIREELESEFFFSFC